MNTKIKLSSQDLQKVNRIKKALLTDTLATPYSNSKLHKQLGEIAHKYNVDTQVIYDAATWKLKGIDY